MIRTMNAALLTINEMIGGIRDGSAGNHSDGWQPDVAVESDQQRRTQEIIMYAPRETAGWRLLVGPYAPMVAEYLPYNPESPKVAAWIIEGIASVDTRLKIEHIGSSAVAGCWGKGIIDLLVLYRSGGFESARDLLDRLGFQHQYGAERFPESRPMRVGSFEYFGRLYRIHAHVIEAGSCEARDLLLFRDLLRSDNTVRQAYEREKRAILSRGIIKSTDYSKAKGDFIRRVLSAKQ